MRCSGATFSLRLLFAGFSISLVMNGILSERGFLDWRRMVRATRELNTKIESARNEKNDLEIRIHRLKTSSFEQKQVVRQALGYVAKGEIVIEF